MAARRVHDRAILDALAAIPPESFAGNIWRITRSGREPLRGSAAHGRWSPGGEFEVLYTSLEREGALAEIGYRLSLEPIWPSKIQHEIHKLEAKTERTLRIADIRVLSSLGVNTDRYESFDYSATQAIAAAAFFLEFDGLRVPSARAPCANLVLFLERLSQNCSIDILATEPVDWDIWRAGQTSSV